MIRVVLPYHLRALARVDGEVKLVVAGPVTQRSVLDALRQPMEDGRVLISRAQQSLAFPARFALVGAMNPCPCGHAGQEPPPGSATAARRRCTCTSAAPTAPASSAGPARRRASGRTRTLARMPGERLVMSGPLNERMDGCASYSGG